MPSRSRRRRGQERASLDQRSRPSPAWKWFTFPVYIALTFGLFVGYNLGIALKPHSRPAEIVLYVVLILFWIGLAQVATRPFSNIMLRRRAKQQQQNDRSSAGSGT